MTIQSVDRNLTLSQEERDRLHREAIVLFDTLRDAEKVALAHVFDCLKADRNVWVLTGDEADAYSAWRSALQDAGPDIATWSVPQYQLLLDGYNRLRLAVASEPQVQVSHAWGGESDESDQATHSH